MAGIGREGVDIKLYGAWWHLTRTTMKVELLSPDYVAAMEGWGNLTLHCPHPGNRPQGTVRHFSIYRTRFG